jgi:hypothetical protein
MPRIIRNVVLVSLLLVGGACLVYGVLALSAYRVRPFPPGKSGPATLRIQSQVENRKWSEKRAIYPLKGQRITLKVDEVPGGKIRWLRIQPDLSTTYKNANHPHEKNPYKWVGFGKIRYLKKELTRYRGKWEIQPFEDNKSLWAKTWSSVNKLGKQYSTGQRYHEDVGSFWFQVEVEKDGRILRSYGIEDSGKRGLSPKVFRVSVRDGGGYLGYLTTFFNVPGVFGSTPYQCHNYIGVDCADVLVAAYGQWKNTTITKDYCVATLVDCLPKVAEFSLIGGSPGKKLRWGKDLYSGDIVAVRYGGRKRYQHIGALSGDANGNGILDRSDPVIHAGPEPLHYSQLGGGNFNGHVVILRFKESRFVLRESWIRHTIKHMMYGTGRW